jgi:hypothetical protein
VSPKQRSFDDFVSEMSQRFHATYRVSDGDRRPSGRGDLRQSIDERLAQCLWFDSLFVQGDLRTESDKGLEIIEPGRWNRSGGPDFKDASLRIDGKLMHGDVEIHLSPEGWRQHRHHLNAEYNDVILHVSLWAGSKEPVRDADGRPIEAFIMEPVLISDLETLSQTLQIENYPYDTPSALGKCQPLMCSLDEDYIGRMLDAAGRERLKSKTERLRSQATGSSLEQVLYQAIMTSMGHKANKGLFFLLSKRAAWTEMIDYLSDVYPESLAHPGETVAMENAERFFEAVMMHVANLVPEETVDDAEMHEHLREIRRLWADVAPYFSDRIIPETNRWIRGVRPPNFPQRRIGGVARLLARQFLGAAPAGRFAETIKEYPTGVKIRERRRWIRKQLVEPFIVGDRENFWAWRYNFTAKRAKRAMKLIGESRGESIVFNALLPLLMVEAESRNDTKGKQAVRRVFNDFAPLQSNSIVRHMRLRLFGDDERADRLLTTEARNQGLFQIFQTCCKMNEQGCEDCIYGQPIEKAS